MTRRIPDMSMMQQVARTHGRNSYAPNMWQSLVGGWPMHVSQKDKVLDLSGRGNIGAMTNMDPATNRVMTPYGWGLDFDGGDDYVDIASMPILSPPFSVTVIFKPDSVDGRCLWSQANSGTVNDRSFIALHTTGYIGKLIVSSCDAGHVEAFEDNSAISTTTCVAGTYYVATGVWAADDLRQIYVNGIYESNNVLSRTPVGRDRTWIGRLADSTPNWEFDGVNVQVIIHARALISSEIAQHAADLNAMWMPRPLQMAFPAPAAVGNPWNYYAQQSA